PRAHRHRHRLRRLRLERAAHPRSASLSRAHGSIVQTGLQPLGAARHPRRELLAGPRRTLNGDARLTRTARAQGEAREMLAGWSRSPPSATSANPAPSSKLPRLAGGAGIASARFTPNSTAIAGATPCGI